MQCGIQMKYTDQTFITGIIFTKAFLAHLLVPKYLFLVKSASQIANYSQKLTPLIVPLDA